MWICPKCKSQVEDDDFMFCWNCNERREDTQSAPACPKCQAPIAADAAFCTGCGQTPEQCAVQPMEESEELAVETVLTRKRVSSAPLDLAAKPAVPENAPEVVRPAPLNLSTSRSVEVVASAVQDTKVFASQFPQWNLQPPALPVRRIRRSL